VDEMLREYLPILVFLAMAIALGLVLILAAVVLAVRNPDPEKVSAYECGFNAFDDARMKFDVRFYLVAILFIIFDLEIAFLFPWAVAFKDISMAGFWSMMARPMALGPQSKRHSSSRHRCVGSSSRPVAAIRWR